MSIAEITVVIAVIALSLLLCYPALDSTKSSIDEYIAITKIINEHNNRIDEVVKLGRPTTLNNVTYYPNLTNQQYIRRTTKHVIIFGKYNTVRIKRR